MLLVVASAVGDWRRLDIEAVSSVSWAGFAWFIVIAIGGFTAFGYLSKTVAPSIATTFSYVNPIVAMTLGWLLYSEPITWRMVIATVVIVIGVCAIVSTKSEAPAKSGHSMTSGYGYRRVLLEPSPGNLDLDARLQVARDRSPLKSIGVAPHRHFEAGLCASAEVCVVQVPRGRRSGKSRAALSAP